MESRKLLPIFSVFSVLKALEILRDSDTVKSFNIEGVVKN
jgi:hypothetical protein